MKERPILFSGPMVRALLDGSKTQTRRVLKPAPEADQKLRAVTASSGFVYAMDSKPLQPFPEARRIRWDCPSGQPGDRLWVKETFYAFGRWETRYSAKKGRDEWHFIDMTAECGKAYLYAADNPRPQPLGGKRSGGVTPTWWKRPAIFMPRAASRITLEITGVRVERLQDISNEDAIAEGIKAIPHGREGTFYHHKRTDPHPNNWCHPDNAFWELWTSINGPGSWNANPWVWVVEFKTEANHG